MLAVVSGEAAKAQSRMVEGTVVGREGSQAAVPLVGVAVVVKGSLRNHAVTDLQGRYSIRVPSSTDT